MSFFDWGFITFGGEHPELIGPAKKSGVTFCFSPKGRYVCLVFPMAGVHRAGGEADSQTLAMQHGRSSLNLDVVLGLTSRVFRDVVFLGEDHFWW